jgi:FMN phosphatase YigB (HAD superfamily)
LKAHWPICGQDTFNIPKPDRRIFDLTVAKADGDPDRAIMIGDSATDIETRARGVRARHRRQFRIYGPTEDFRS